MRQIIRKIRRFAFCAELFAGLACARFLIKFVKFSRWRKLLGPLNGNSEDWPQITPAKRRKAADTGRLVNRIASHAPFKAVCLPRAMAARWSLARRGIESRITIGSRRGDEMSGEKERLLFHAWLMVDDIIVTGAEEREQFLAFTGQSASVGGSGKSQ